MRSLWFVAFAGPAAWSLHSLLSTALVPVACGTRLDSLLLHFVTLALTVLALSGIVVARRLPALPDGQRFVATTSIFVNAFFALVVIAEGVPNFVVSPCLS